MECSDEGASQPEQFWVCDGERPAACRLCFLSEPPPYPLAYLPSLPCVQLPPPALWGTDLVVLYHFHPTFSHTVTACRQQQQQHPQPPPPSTSPNSKYDQYAIFSSSLSSLPPTPPPNPKLLCEAPALSIRCASEIAGMPARSWWGPPLI